MTTADDGYSGFSYDRPGFQAMLSEIEAGHVAVCLTKDLSRLGRNSALTGLYTNFTFPQNGVRYIAINDSFDTADQNSVNSDFAGLKNWFNEFYCRDTSRKIRAVQKAKGERGVPLTVNVPYGYVKDPEDRTKWLIDPEAAAIVKSRTETLKSSSRKPAGMRALRRLMPTPSMNWCRRSMWTRRTSPAASGCSTSTSSMTGSALSLWMN